MRLPLLRRKGLLIAIAAVAVVGAACSTPEPEAPPPAPAPPPPPPPPPLALNQGVTEAASVYVAFIRDMRTLEAGFQTPEAIQESIRRGAAYEPGHLSRGMIAYGAVLALQSPEFVEGVRAYAADPAQRQDMIARIVADPFYAASLPGADRAAALIVSVIAEDVAVLTAIAEAVETDAYTIQERRDPRRRWATTPVANRDGRLEYAKTASAAPMAPVVDEAARLFAAAHMGQGLDVSGGALAAPYPRAVAQSLAIAALAALGAGGEDGRAVTEALSVEADSEFCLGMSKLNLFQCLAASRPSYEDIFCLGRHIVRDLATCSSSAMIPVAPVAGEPVLAEGGQSPVAAEAAAAGAAARNASN